jgi:diguanylate cyclase (GGDEF)-like protein
MGNHPDSSGQRERLHLGVRGKVVAILLATLVVTLTVNSLLALRAQERDILEETERRGREATHFISQYIAYSVVSYDYHTIELLLQDLTRGHDIVYARVESNRGNVMAAAGTPPAADGHVRQYSESIRLNGEILGRLFLSLSTERIVHTLAARQREVLVGQLVAIVAVMLVGLLALSAIIVRPLSLFARVIHRNLDTGDPRLERVPLDSADEFGDLARGFNALQERLDDARRKLESRINLADRELQSAYEQLAAQAQELRHVNRELEQLSITDPLTGLFNRRYFERLMESEVGHSIRNDETISILLLDIDNFKLINERYGHTAGDEVLRHTARILSERIRLTDVACRYGGDEFFVLCRRATIANALSIADDMHRSISDRPLHLQGDEVSIAVSIGVATIPGVHRVTTTEGFFHCADEALRYCKQHGRNGVVHYSMLDRQPRSLTV